MHKLKQLLKNNIIIDLNENIEVENLYKNLFKYIKIFEKKFLLINVKFLIRINTELYQSNRSYYIKKIISNKKKLEIKNNTKLILLLTIILKNYDLKSR